MAALALAPRGSWTRWGLLALHGLLALYLLRLLPEAQAYAQWGVSYPPVMVRGDLPGCDQHLAQAIASGACCLFDVTAGRPARERGAALGHRGGAAAVRRRLPSLPPRRP